MGRLAKDNVVYHSLRLNLNHEQHVRIHQILTGLDTSIHKSINQFIVQALDSYITGFEREELVHQNKEGKEDTEIITKDILLTYRDQLMNEMKEEMLRIFGTILFNGQEAGLKSFDSRGRNPEKTTNTGGDKEEEIMSGLASMWG